MGVFNFSLLSSENPGVYTERTITVNRSVSCVKETVKGCRDRLSDAEYQRLVDLGHRHYRRQRRRSRR
jgi:hypothetical protein